MFSKLYTVASAFENAVKPKPEEITWLERKVLTEEIGACDFRLATERGDSMLLDEVSEIYSHYDIYRRPKVIIYEHKIPNAANLVNGTLLVSTSLLKLLNQRERKMVIAHEAGHHIQKKWLLVVGVVAGIGATILSALGVSKLERDGRLETNNENLNKVVKPLLFVSVFGLITQGLSAVFALPVMAISRAMERDADRKAVNKVRDPEALISGLKKIKYRVLHSEENKIPDTDIILSKPPPSIPITDRASEEQVADHDSVKDYVRTAYHSHPEFSKRFKNIRESGHAEGIDSEALVENSSQYL